MALSKIDGTNFIAPTIPVSAGGTGSATLAGAGLVNTPAFFATTSSQQTLTDQSNVKIQFATEVIDTDNCYDPSTNYRFTPTTSGKYFIFLDVTVETNGGVSTMNYIFIDIYKNGSVVHRAYVDTSENNGYAMQGSVSAIISMNGSSDYVEAYANVNATSGNGKVQSSQYTMFGGYKIIE
jgi:hypothetical protein